MIVIDKSFKSPWNNKDEGVKNEVGDNHAINKIITITWRYVVESKDIPQRKAYCLESGRKTTFCFNMI